MWSSKKYHTKENKKWEYIHRNKSKYTEEEIKNKIDAENKDLESLRKVLENIVNGEKQNLEEIEKNSEQIKNCEKEIREYENKIYNIKHNLKKSQKDLLLNLAELLKINEKIKKFALNKSHAGTENDYLY